MATLYISSSLLKRDTALGSTVDDNLLQPYIRIAQDRWILPALGTKLDDYLKTQVDADTVTGAYQTLLEDYIQPCLVQLAFSEVAYVVRLRFANNSVITNSSEQGQPSSTTDIKRVVEQSQEIGMFYRERLIEYLCFNASSFPQYVTNTGADVSPSRRNYFGGLNVYPELNWNDNQLKAFASAIGVRYLNA
tara:strand:+ start:5098 stop:5670 length:573 start_codon:yes stop_codon:yes gene_type:complete